MDRMEDGDNEKEDVVEKEEEEEGKEAEDAVEKEEEEKGKKEMKMARMMKKKQRLEMLRM